MTVRRTRMPLALTSLSLIGLIPLVYLAFGAVGHIPETSERMLIALVDYAALILTFAGGVHWGLALQPETLRPAARFGGGVVPLIIAWISLIVSQLVSPTVALVVLIAGYLATILVEHRAAKRYLLPSRYVWLRWGFSLVAIVMMTMVCVLRSVGQTIVF